MTKAIYLGDPALEDGRILTDSDRQVLADVASGRGVPLVAGPAGEVRAGTAGAKDFLSVMRGAVDAISATVLTMITPSRAARIREWRVRGSLRWVAQQAHREWGGDWWPPDNQIAGVLLCEAAARAVGEDPGVHPWTTRGNREAMEKVLADAQRRTS